MTNYFDYQYLSDTRSYYYEMARKAKQLFRYRQFYAITTSVERVLKNYFDQEDREEFFLEYFSQRKIPTHDSLIAEREYNTIVTSDLNETLSGDNYMLLCFHLGAYRSFINHLVALGKDFTLVVNNNLYQNDKGIDRAISQTKELFDSKSKVTILNAEEPSTGIKLYKRMETSTIVAFVDGNTGIGGHYNKSNSYKITFGGEPFFVRKGLIELALRRGVKIYSALNYYDKDYQIIYKQLDVPKNIKLSLIHI